MGGRHALPSPLMPEPPKHRRKPTPGEKTEETPKGLEVPVPKRGAFFENLRKTAEPEGGKDGRRCAD